MLSPADVEPSAAQPPPNNLVARPKRASGVVGVPRSPVRRSRSPPQFIGSSSAGSSAAGAASYSSPPQFIGSSSAGASAAGAASNSSPPQFIGSRSTAAAGPRSSAEAAGGHHLCRMEEDCIGSNGDVIFMHFLHGQAGDLYCGPCWQQANTIARDMIKEGSPIEPLVGLPMIEYKGPSGWQKVRAMKNPVCTNREDCRGWPGDQLVRHIMKGKPGDIYCRTCWDYHKRDETFDGALKGVVYNMQQIASDLRRRASSSGELGAIGRSRSGTAFPSPYAQAAVRPPPVRPPRRGRQLCDRCRRQRPGDRIRCVRCQRRVGPGCTPGCLLVELRGTARQRVGLCADWPHCRSPGVEVSRVQAVTEALFPLYPDDG